MRMRSLGITTAVALVGSLLVATPGRTVVRPAEAWAVQQEKSVPGRNAVAVAPKDPEKQDFSPAVTWPAPATADVAVTAGGVRTGTITLAGPPGKARVEMLGRRQDSLLFRVDTAKAASVTVDYSGFRDTYGGDWAARLRLVRLPECSGCRRTVLPTRNDGSGTLSGVLPAGGLFAVTAADSSGAGDYKASPLAPSATWTAGGSSGDFSWSYPIQTPPALTGPAPQLALTYSSGSVDGRGSATNNQPSWAGEGFEFNPGGYIERRYTGCATDTAGGNNSGRKTGDLCWRTDNATFSLNGKGGELVRDDATLQWHPRNDDGSRVERLLLPEGSPNGDNDREYWKITSRDGTQFFFGLNRLPGYEAGDELTASVWNVPVYGNHGTEPCHKTSFSESACYQAWRWNLDYVVDPHGNTMSYFYGTERDNVASNLTATAVRWYIRGGYLKRIDYGQRDGQVYDTDPIARVEITTADRCAPDTVCDFAHPSSWPDTPVDQHCGSETNCKDHYSPTFWTAKRLAKITTRVREGAGFKDVNSWTLTHSFPPSGDGSTSRRLWLSSIKHSGLVGGTFDMPETRFEGIELPNRVDGIEGIPPMYWRRMSGITTETGGQIAVDYLPSDCAVTTGLPAPDTNGKRCYPMKWTPDSLDNQAPQRTDWFNKYVVTSVSEKDLTTELPATETSYEYPRAPAWRHDDEDGMVPQERKTWSQWRGYDQVRVRKGHPGQLRSLTETRYFRGMDQDKTAGGGRKSISVTDSKGQAWPDSNEFASTEREKVVFTGEAMLSRTITDPWLSLPTATSVRSWGTTRAYHLQESRVLQGEMLSDGRWRESATNHVYDSRGVLQQQEDLNNLADPSDDSCSRYTYNTNQSAWLLELPSRIQTVATSCGATPSYPDDIISDERLYYDNSNDLAAPPVRGDRTRKEEFSGWVDGAPTYVTTMRSTYDQHGRQVDVFDVFNQKTSTSYTPTSGALPTKVSVTNPLGHVSYTELEPAWGAEKAVVDANNRRTEIAYDAMGRATKVWLPGRDRATQSPSKEFSYLTRTTGPNVITTKELQPDGGYLTEYSLYDGQLRLRQSQQVAPGGGRTILDHVYDARGLEVKQNGPYYNDAPPGMDVFIPDEAQLPAQNVTEYDGADRPIAHIFKVEGVERWRTTESLYADRQDTDPPSGETPTTRIYDDEGQLVELRQYKGDSPTGDYDKTTYTYTNRKQLSSVTDPAANVWRYSYDLRGRKIRTEDPDNGVTSYTYDDGDRLLTETDARGITLSYSYDELGRKVAVRQGSTKRAEWVYDTLAKGLLTSSSRFVGSAAYTTSVDGYDNANRPTGSTITIPASEGKLAGTYRTGVTYHADGEIATNSLPAVGGLPAETLSFGFNSVGLPSTLRGATPYVASTAYTPYGERQQVTLSSGGKWVKHTFEYELGTRRVTRAVTDRAVTDREGGGRVSNVAYRYDAAGNITRIADSTDSDAQCFKYDYLRRLATAWTPGSGDCAAAPTAAALGGPAPYWNAWTFDKVGNRLSQTKTAPDGRATTTTYEYPEPGQPQPHALRRSTTGGTVAEYGYDATGNTTRRAGQTLEWDAEGQLAKVTENGRTTSFVYTADGNRLIRHDPSGSTLYLGDTEIHVDGSGVVSGTRYYTFDGRPVAVRTSSDGRLTWLGLDHHGTAQVAIDSATQEVQRRRLGPYGESRGAAPASWPGQRGFVGGTSDPSTGLTHLGAREYDPTSGRFVSVDPEIDHNDPQQLHGYSYANNSPVTFSDPDGRSWFADLFTKVVVRPITQMVPKQVQDIVSKWVPQVVNSVVQHVLKKFPVIKTVIKAVVKFVKKVQKIVKKVAKVIHRAAKVVMKAAKKAAQQVADGAKWVGKNAMPGGAIWNVAKIGLGIAGLFGCGVCLAASAIMTGVDVLIAMSKGDHAGAAMEAMSILPGGKLLKGAAALGAVGAGAVKGGAAAAAGAAGAAGAGKAVIKNGKVSSLDLGIARTPLSKTKPGVVQPQKRSMEQDFDEGSIGAPGIQPGVNRTPVQRAVEFVGLMSWGVCKALGIC